MFLPAPFFRSPYAQHIVLAPKKLTTTAHHTTLSPSAAMSARRGGLRVVSLLPSTTEIMGRLGLGRYLTGITHECDVCPDEAGLEALLERGVQRVTTSDINPHAMSQGEIDMKVKTSIKSGLSLYGVKEDLLRAAAPNLVLTQTLCAVCAPAKEEVELVCKRLGDALVANDGDDASVAPSILSLEPGNLEDVVDTFYTVAQACGEPALGRALQDEFRAEMSALQQVVGDLPEKPSVVLLEWLDPLFDGGHWVPDVIAAAGCRYAHDVLSLLI